MYKHLVDLLPKAARCKTYNTEYDFIVRFYGNDLDKLNLKVQLDLLATQFKHSGNSSPTFHDIKDYLVSLSPAASTLMSEVCTVL